MSPGECITYTFTVTTPATSTLTDVTVTDVVPGRRGLRRGDVAGDVGSRRVWTCTADYTVTQADVDAGADREHGDGRHRPDRPVTDIETVPGRRRSGAGAGQDVRCSMTA